MKSILLQKYFRKILFHKLLVIKPFNVFLNIYVHMCYRSLRNVTRCFSNNGKISMLVFCKHFVVIQCVNISCVEIH